MALAIEISSRELDGGKLLRLPPDIGNSPLKLATGEYSSCWPWPANGAAFRVSPIGPELGRLAAFAVIPDVNLSTSKVTRSQTLDAKLGFNELVRSVRLKPAGDKCWGKGGKGRR